MEAIPLYRPDIEGNERRYVLECLDSSWISSRGKFIALFEEAFAREIGVEHAVAVCNGTAALHLALLALDLGHGDEVIVPTFTYIASVNAIAYTGATPVFADVDPKTWQIDKNTVERQISSRTKAILPVHLYGNACEMDGLRELARRHGLFLVEDCAEGFGTRFSGTHVGGFGEVGTFSFFGNKTITTGEGGMVVSNDAQTIERVRHLRGQGLASGHEYWHDVIGYNYRMTNIAAALGLAQLERASEFLMRKKSIAERYRRRLIDLPLEFQCSQPAAVHSHWMIAILVESATVRDALREHLRSLKVETRPTFPPVHSMPMYARRGLDFPVSTDLAGRGVVLPSWPGLSDQQVDRICDHIGEFFSKRRE